MVSRAPISGPRYSKDEFAKRGDALYDERIGAKVQAAHHGKYVAIDIETGEYEIDDDEMNATDRLLARIPDAQIWFRRIGSKVARRFGGRPRKKGP